MLQFILMGTMLEKNEWFLRKEWIHNEFLKLKNILKESLKVTCGLKKYELIMSYFICLKMMKSDFFLKN